MHPQNVNEFITANRSQQKTKRRVARITDQGVHIIASCGVTASGAAVRQGQGLLRRRAPAD